MDGKDAACPIITRQITQNTCVAQRGEPQFPEAHMKGVAQPPSAVLLRTLCEGCHETEQL